MPYHQGLLSQQRPPDDLGGLLDPNIVKRGMLLPLGRTKQGEMEFAVPEILLSLARSARLPGRVAQGYPWTPKDVTEMAMNVAGTGYLGGGLLTGSVPKGAVLGANVWHGGPNRWMPEPGYPQGRPLLSRVGTGEGAQAYGHGFYSAESKGVAESYYQALSKKKFDALSKEEQALVPDWVSNRILQGDPESGVNSAIIEFTNRMQDDIAQLKDPNVRQPWLIEERIAGHKKRIKALEKLETSKDFGATETGQLKKLDIPDEDIAKMLDWDAPLSGQPGMVRKIKALADDPDSPFTGHVQRQIKEALQDFELNNTTGETLVHILGGDKAASEALRKAGIPGLKYYDQMSRGKGWSGSDPHLGAEYAAKEIVDRLKKLGISVEITKNPATDKQIQKSINQIGGKSGYFDLDIRAGDRRFKPTIRVSDHAAARGGVATGDTHVSRVDELIDEAIKKYAEVAGVDPSSQLIGGTRNYVVWDQDVLNRTRILASGGE